MFENADGGGRVWAQHTVYVGDEHHDGAQIVDIDQDGDFDIISIGWGHGRVLLYENQSTGSGTPGGGSGSPSLRLGAWGFEETSGDQVLDSTYGNHDGTLADGATRSPNGVFGRALETNGQAGHVSLRTMDADAAGLTIMAWINADDFGVADARIISKSNGSAEQDHLWMLSTVSGPRLRFRLKTDGNTSTLVGTDATLAAGTWIHAAATYDGSTMKLFQDGVLVGSLPKAGLIDRDLLVPVWIGANPGAPGQVFDGRIDEVQVFNRALSPTEIANAMATPLPRPPPDPTCAATPGRESHRHAWVLAALIGMVIWRRRIAALSARRG
ncbi:MAG: LamG domain-containing protein [Deltaproteobacteria bacterium]|nr:LamG domain-containing protein [Deltaproteobacteria bacterium]